MTPTEPTTEAGRDALHAVGSIGEAHNIDIDYEQWRKRILAIEAEARKIGDVERVLLFEAGMAEARATLDVELMARSLLRRYPQLRVSVPELMMGLDIAIEYARTSAQEQDR